LALDPNFGDGGQIETRQPAGAAYSVAIQPDNMIVVGGGFAATLGGRMDFGLARFDNSGAIDAVFGSYDVSAQDLGEENKGVGCLWGRNSGTVKPVGRLSIASVTLWRVSATIVGAVARKFSNVIAGVVV
jgi:hypothetical protein